MIRNLLFVAFIVMLSGSAFGGREAAVYDGKVYGIFEPLKTLETPKTITVTGGTFQYVVDRSIGQLVSAKVLNTEFLAIRSSFPNPYIGVMPEDDPGARREGDKDRPRFGYEKAVERRPSLWSGELTDAFRFDAASGSEIKTELVSSGPEMVEVRATGRYGHTPLSWQVDYVFDVDSFTKITVSLSTSKAVLLRWNCFNHTLLAKDSAEYLTKVNDPKGPPTEVLPEPTISLRGVEPDQPVFESHWNAFFHLANRVTGIEFSKQDFGDRWSGYRDSSVELESGTTVDTGSVATKDGRVLNGWDSRGKSNIFTQLYMRDRALEIEEFDIRNATYPFNPGDLRKRVFWVQTTPAKHPRDDLNSVRVVWPGPHQIVMTRWRGTQAPWEPPSDPQVKIWAQAGVNLIVGGANYWSGDYARPLAPEKTRHFIKTAHNYGIKVIPYVTFADFNFNAPGYQEHAADWMASAGIEYANETTLMCYSAEGWRDFLEKQWDQLLAEFDFDGLYVDHWINIRFCNNSRHGCGGYLGSFATEGYHDFAKRARRVVARHTAGQGVMLLNANMLLFSGVVPWFDIRLNGENDDPLKMTTETLAATWNGWGQGVQSLGEWRASQDSRAMLDLLTMLMVPSPLDGTRLTLEDWNNSQTPELTTAREMWGYWRFFGLNGAHRFSSFDAGDVIAMAGPGSIVNGFSRNGRILAVMGVPGGCGPRSDKLQILAPGKLGLRESVRYRLVDLRKNCFLSSRSYSVSDLAQIPVTLAGTEPLILLIEPEQKGPRVVYFNGADQILATGSGGKLELRIKAVPGSPLEIHLDAAGGNYRSETAGFVRRTVPGVFAVFAGTVPDDGVVILSK
ncbi:MAG TPA: DUF6259 domain-containing protein [Terriglobia bacterium]|nr:DUF6259 domain-containing protein [Terriglobia bacterium]